MLGDNKHAAAEEAMHEKATVEKGYVQEHNGEVTNEYLQQIEAMSVEERAAFEKKLVRKMDIRLLPWMT